jgi:predicted nucleic acid-binding protein
MMMFDTNIISQLRDRRATVWIRPRHCRNSTGRGAQVATLNPRDFQPIARHFPALAVIDPLTA